MTTKSRIEWTEHTWNPVTGCTNVSPGCKHCYARSFAERLKAMGAPGYASGFAVTLHPERLLDPTKRKRPTVYFVNSMSDLFHDQVPDEFVERILDVVERTPQHRYQILTKRADRMAAFFASRAVPANAWLGVSVENRRHGLPRVAQLRKIAAPVRFLSVEPLLERLGRFDLDGIDWVIVGGESGQRARPMLIEWVRELRDDCVRRAVPFFFKQWGAWGVDGVRRSKGANGRDLDGRTWDEMPSPRGVAA